jgi:hypothetical protein
MNWLSQTFTQASPVLGNLFILSFVPPGLKTRSGALCFKVCVPGQRARQAFNQPDDNNDHLSLITPADITRN